MGKPGHPEAGRLCDELGIHSWLSLAGPKLEAGTQTDRKAVSYESRIGHLEPFVTELLVWLPELFLAIPG